MMWHKRRVLRWSSGALALVALAILIVTEREAHTLITNANPRRLPTKQPTDFSMPYEDVAVTTSDGLKLVGWFVRSPHRAVVVLLHGYKDSRAAVLTTARMLYRKGYSVLIPAMRAHDRSQGDVITFGYLEMRDMDAWIKYLCSRPDVDENRMGLYGASLGGTIAIEFAARDPRIKAVVAQSAFSSLDDTLSTSVRYFTGFSARPLVTLILHWAEYEAHFDAADINAKQWIGHITPRAVLLMQGGTDRVISPDSGTLLYQAAGEPKELWYEPTFGHADFSRRQPEEFERRVVSFFSRYVPIDR